MKERAEQGIPLREVESSYFQGELAYYPVIAAQYTHVAFTVAEHDARERVIALVESYFGGSHSVRASDVRYALDALRSDPTEGTP